MEFVVSNRLGNYPTHYLICYMQFRTSTSLWPEGKYQLELEGYSVRKGQRYQCQVGRAWPGLRLGGTDYLGRNY